MHRHRIIAQISLVFSILNLVYTAPIVVQEIHEARSNEIVVAAGDVMMEAAPNNWGQSEAVSDRSTSPSPRSAPDASRTRRASSHDSSETLPDVTALPQEPHSPTGSSSSGHSYDAPWVWDPSNPDHISAWILNRPDGPPHPSPPPPGPAPLHDSASHVPGPGPPEIPPFPSPEGQDFSIPNPLVPVPAPAPPPLRRPSRPSHPFSSGPSDILPSPGLSAPWASRPSSPGWIPENSMQGGVAPTRRPTTNVSPRPLYSLSTAVHSDDEEFDKKLKLMKKVGIVTTVLVAGGTLITILASIAHHRQQDS